MIWIMVKVLVWQFENLFNYYNLILILVAVKVATDSVKSINDSYISYPVKFQLS